MRILGLIPARGDSKGIVDKNIVNLAGKPLIYYTIQQAVKVNLFERVFVSTDSEKIKTVCESIGLEVPFLRSKHLAQDNTRTIDVVIDLLESLKESYNEEYDYVCLLQPTSPLRSVQDIKNCIEIIRAKKEGSVISISLINEPHPYKMQVIENGLIYPFLKGSDSSTPRQELPAVYELNGAVFLTDVETIMEKRSFFGEKCYPYIMPAERSVDINSDLDLAFATMLISNE